MWRRCFVSKSAVLFYFFAISGTAPPANFLSRIPEVLTTRDSGGECKQFQKFNSTSRLLEIVGQNNGSYQTSPGKNIFEFEPQGFTRKCEKVAWVLCWFLVLMLLTKLLFPSKKVTIFLRNLQTIEVRCSVNPINFRFLELSQLWSSFATDHLSPRRSLFFNDLTELGRTLRVANFLPVLIATSNERGIIWVPKKRNSAFDGIGEDFFQKKTAVVSSPITLLSLPA